MKIKQMISKLICIAVIAAMCTTMVACSSSQEAKVSADGYQLPYEYSDGYTAKLKTTDDTTYLITSTDLIGNKVVQFKTDKSEEEVKKVVEVVNSFK